VSSHRPSAPPPEHPYSRHYTIKVVCDHEGRGTATPRTVLHHLGDRRTLTHRDADLIAVTAGPAGRPLRTAPAQPWTAEDDGRRTWTFRCPRCSRNLRLREENLLQVIDLLREETGPAADLGHLVVPIGLADRMAALLR
jgi:hypothetical protein